MLTDPQSITVNGSAKSLPKVETGGRRSVYASADQKFGMMISHQDQKDRVRSVMKVTQVEIVADPITAINDSETLGISVIWDKPKFGFTVAQIQQLTAAVVAKLTDSLVAQIAGQES